VQRIIAFRGLKALFILMGLLPCHTVAALERQDWKLRRRVVEGEVIFVT
jgi:hypothetical protein